MQSSNARQPYTDNRRDRRREIAHMRNRDHQQDPRQYRVKPIKKRRKLPSEYERIKNSTPIITKRGRVFYVVDNGRGQYRIPRSLLISLAVIFVCAIMVVATQVHISGMERQITAANRQLTRTVEIGEAIESQIGIHYTMDRVQEIAITQLGMVLPDPSQIIEIYVPRQNHLEFNTAAHFLPRDNYLWSDIRVFMNGIFDRVFRRS